MEFLENQGYAPDPKSGQFLWEVCVSGLNMNFWNNWHRFFIERNLTSQYFRQR